VTVLVAVGNAAAIAAKNATVTIPIVFEVGIDPVAYGLVPSLARPGGNVTGVTFLGAELTTKQLEILHEVVPKGTVIGMLENPTNPNAETVRRDVQAAANALGRKLVIGTATVESESRGLSQASRNSGLEACLCGQTCSSTASRRCSSHSRPGMPCLQCSLCVIFLLPAG
jgi:putative ABC transport system substrate-binding protein